VDILISLAWFAAFGVLVDTIKHQACGSIWNWDSWDSRGHSACGRWKSAEAFSFLSAIVWLVSGIVVLIIYFVSFCELILTASSRASGLLSAFAAAPLMERTLHVQLV